MGEAKRRQPNKALRVAEGVAKREALLEARAKFNEKSRSEVGRAYTELSPTAKTVVAVTGLVG